MSELWLLMSLIIGISVFGLLFAAFLARWVVGKPTGSEAMRRISDAIKEGAEAFLRRQNRTILVLAVVFAAVLFIGYGFLRAHHQFDPVQSPLHLAFWITFSFVLGALCSVFAGYVGMWVSIRSNIRTANAALTSLNDALQIALRGGAVSGLLVVAMSLLGVAGLYAIVDASKTAKPEDIPLLIIGYGFGASFVALFAQLGGGIYTKAADVGADLVGKVEAGIPEDDPRNPAVIADLVGDNVGDCAGRGADLFESTAAENIGAMILGASLATAADKLGVGFSMGIIGVMMFPLVARAFGIIACIIGIMSVRMDKEEKMDPMQALNRGYYVAVVLAMIAFGGATYWLLNSPKAPDAWWHFYLCGIVGVLCSVAFVYITQYYTEYRFRPVQSIAEASLTGPATNIISGLAVGMETPAMPVIVICSALLLSYYFGVKGLSGVHLPGISNYVKGIYGTAIATMGMLSCAAYILAMDTFGPITDNAGGIIEMSNQPDSVRDKTDKLDSAGNTTKALTKGYAVGSASLAAFLLFSAYLEEIKSLVTAKVAAAGPAGFMPEGWSFTNINLAEIPVFAGAMLGAMLVYLFSSMAIKAVGRTAQMVVKDVRDQFRENPGIVAGTSKPDYARCVSIVTGAALKEMVLPGILAVGLPVAVGLIFRNFSSVYGAGSEVLTRTGLRNVPSINGIPVNLGGATAVAGLLMVGTISGVLLAMLMNNGGGAWDNAKKWIETGQYGGKKSDAHKAAVVGDTVGDPFKDTAGPSLHVLIKLLATITLVLAPLFL